ncbi:alanine racemase [Orbus hercynius]|uniref:Alanine racemase n=1 Tax=Orbus hercynius TaxID=593135 RepID=A0A495RDT5_9GAMM|nr:alanine racemase [Orbus hercynius]RKS85108.1 alanine racemase [Orbus hercynius]
MSIATIEVSISALLHNVAAFKTLSPNSQIMAIVKANAYSHGKNMIATCLDDVVDYFGVARLEEGIELRKIGIKSPIVLLEGFFLHDEVTQLLKYNLQTVIHCQEQIDKLKYLDLPAGSLDVWFKLDSGMHRLGFRPEQAGQAFQSLCDCQVIKQSINVMSHFCCADDVRSSITTEQMTIFDQFIATACDPSRIGKQSIAASGGILAWPVSHRDVIRPGIALYGVSPFSYDEPNRATGAGLGLKPVMVFKSEIITVREHKEGESLGYGLIWQAQYSTRLAVVAMGYGDGYPRDILANTPVWINQRMVPIVGRVAMDMILVDLGPNATDKAGDEVILWGNDALPVEKIAAHSGMSAYELLTRLTERAKLRYVD